MAATPFSPHPLNASFSPFNIFNDGGGAAARETPPHTYPSLPGGPCNFVDLTHGPNGPKCGCRRFWSRQVTGAGGSTTADHMSWCMCSHHACFHDDAQNTQGQPIPAPAVDNTRGQENERPKSNRAPLSPAQAFASLHTPNNMDTAAIDLATFNFDTFPLDPGLDLDLPPANPPGPPPQDNESMPDTMSWKNVLSTQGGQTSLPPLPSQCLLPASQAASTTSSGSLTYLRPFGGKGLNTLSSVPLKNRNHASNESPGRSAAPAPAAGPEHRCTHDGMPIGSEGGKTPAPGVLRRMESPPASPAQPAGRDAETLHNLADAIDGHEQRLDRLETSSTYNAAHEECSDRHDLADLRVTELESRMDDVEKKLNDDTTSVYSSRHSPQRDDDATVSVVSGPPVTDPAAVAGRAALSSQLEALQTRVNQLSAASVPSYSSPWELEVVFLPFPLKGIWQGAQEFKTPRLSAGRDEWVQTPNTNSRATPDPQAHTACDEWAGEDSAWLLPRACVPGRMIDQRLRSRGLIKTVSVRGPDARSVQIAVGNAFEGILRLMPSPADPRSPYASDPRVERFFGFRQPWVPLRKVHKDSRLRLLSPAELVTPVLWDTAFLMNVVMKATGIHRLYITQPEAYLQDSHLSSYRGVEPDWSWQKLRELTPVYPESQASNSGSEIAGADALEEYWKYNARLDEPSAPRLPPVNLYQPRDRAFTMSRTSDGSTQQFFTGPSNIMSSMSPILTRGQSPLMQMEPRSSRPPSLRAVSVPPIHSPVLPSPRSSRRKSSYSSYTINPAFSRSSHGRHPSPLTPARPSPRLSLVTNPPLASMVTKDRRRATRSPSIRFQHTPRHSHRSYSRSPSVAPLFQNVLGEEVERRVAPLAYATPFSNAPPESPQRLRDRSVRLLEDEDEDMASVDDHGSSTDEYDDPDIDVYEDENDMLDNIESDSDHHRRSRRQNHHHNHRSSPQGRQAHIQQPLQEQQSPSQPQGPEDEPWPGIEDNAMSNEENVNPRDAEGDEMDDDSDTSSEPSEYASTQRAWQLLAAGEGREMTHGLEGDEAGVGSIGFNIHEDESEDESDG